MHPLPLLVCRAWSWTKGTPDLGTRVFSCFHQLFAEGMGTMKKFSKQCIFSNDSYLEFELSCVMFALGQIILTCGMSKCPFGDFRREVSELSCKGWVGSRPIIKTYSMRLHVEDSFINQMLLLWPLLIEMLGLFFEPTWLLDDVFRFLHGEFFLVQGKQSKHPRTFNWQSNHKMCT